MENKTMFVVFNDVIKTPSMAILKGLLEPGMKENFSSVIDYTRFEFMNDDNLLRLCIQRTDKNILKYLGTSEDFDYDKMYDTMYKTITDKFTPYPSLRMVEVLAMAISTPQVGTVCVYSDTYEPEIQTELGLLFNANSKKIKYVNGGLTRALSGRNVSLFVLPDLDYLDKLYDIYPMNGKEVLIGNYGYNYTLDESGNLVFKFDLEKSITHQSIFKLRAFAPFELQERHITQTMNNVDENNNLSLG